jgi:probable F420-dependent oxidoreductase
MAHVGAIGVWSSSLRLGDAHQVADAAGELEEIGFDAIWVPGRGAVDLEERLRLLLSSTERIAVATGIVSIWTNPADETAAMRARLAAEFGDRFLLGLGVSHAPLVDGGGGKYTRPFSEMVAYLDELDAAPEPVLPEQRILAALAPKMLRLARERALGSHPYLTTPAHTRIARDALGPDALLAPELTVVLETDPDQARAIARAFITRYLQLPNYVDNLLRTGFEPADVEGGGSDRLIDDVIAWGDADAILAKIADHRAAGADHVALQVLTADPERLPREEWRQLAAALR